MAVTIRKSVESDLPALLDIYNHEVEHGVATFDLKPLTLEERAVWFYEHNKENHPLSATRHSLPSPQKPRITARWSSPSMWPPTAAVTA